MKNMNDDDYNDNFQNDNNDTSNMSNDNELCYWYENYNFHNLYYYYHMVFIVILNKCRYIHIFKNNDALQTKKQFNKYSPFVTYMYKVR